MAEALEKISGTGHPFGAARSLGDFVEDEYLLRGEADALDPEGGLLASSVPYCTRVVVRRPTDGASGTVIIEPFHNIHEMAYMWRLLAPWITLGRHTWMGVTVHSGSYPNPFGDTPGGVPLLRLSDPGRYGALDLAQFQVAPPRRMQQGPAGFDPLAMRWRLAMAHPQGAGIASALATAARRGHFDDVVALRTIAVGTSQTGNFWRLFLEGNHHTDDIDGYVVMVAPPPSVRPKGASIVSLLSEGEVVGTLYPRMMRALEDGNAPMTRGYEMGGTAHLLHARDVKRAADHTSIHNLRPFDALARAVVANLEDWLRTGTPMPPSAHISRDESSLDGVARDMHGNALGGLRGPWLDVPTAQYLARCTCGPTVGEMIPFGDDTFSTLYGSRASFNDAFRRDVDAKEAARILLPFDAALLRKNPE